MSELGKVPPTYVMERVGRQYEPSGASQYSLVPEKSLETVLSEQDDEFGREMAEFLGTFEFDTERHIVDLHLTSTLNKRQRALTHSIAECLGLEHVSRGFGKKRHLVVSRPQILVQEHMSFGTQQVLIVL